MVKFYLDSSIWRDYYENRKDRFRPLGEWALRLLQLIIENKDDVLYSELTIEELSKEYSIEEINKIFEIAKGFLFIVEASDAQLDEAKQLAKKHKIPKSDALHAIHSRDNNAILIARDHHFDELQDIAEIKKPEDLI